MEMDIYTALRIRQKELRVKVNKRLEEHYKKEEGIESSEINALIDVLAEILLLMDIQK